VYKGAAAIGVIASKDAAKENTFPKSAINFVDFVDI